MKTPVHALPTLLIAALAVAQGDTVTLASGTVVENATVQAFTIRELKYTQGAKNETIPTDQVAKIQLGKFADVYKRSVANKDPDLMLTEARNQLNTAKNTLLAQFGYVECARLYYLGGNDANGGGALEEMQKLIPDAGLLPEVYRLKFENYMGNGDAAGFQNATLVAKKFATEATTSAWPGGFALEADFFVALAEQTSAGDPKVFQSKMRDLSGRAAAFPGLVARMQVQLGNSLFLTKDVDGATKVYQDVLGNAASDENSRGGAYLGLGKIAMAKGDAANREPFREALLSFLRVRVETKNSWGSLQAEALYNAMLAAEKWGGADYRLIQGRCRQLLLSNFGDSEWAARAKGQ